MTSPIIAWILYRFKLYIPAILVALLPAMFFNLIPKNILLFAMCHVNITTSTILTETVV